MKFVVIEPSNAEQVKSEVLEAVYSRPSFMRFHSPYCGHCKAMQNDFNALRNHSNLLNKNVNVIDVDVDTLSKIPLSATKQAIGQPIPLMIMSDTSGQAIEEYDGERDTESIAKFIINSLRKHEGQSGGRKKNKSTHKKQTRSKKNKSTHKKQTRSKKIKFTVNRRRKHTSKRRNKVIYL